MPTVSARQQVIRAKAGRLAIYDIDKTIGNYKYYGGPHYDKHHIYNLGLDTDSDSPY